MTHLFGSSNKRNLPRRFEFFIIIATKKWALKLIRAKHIETKSHDFFANETSLV